MVNGKPINLVAIGEGLTAGMGDFSLSTYSQQYSFPALMARQMNVPFPQPLLQPPGIGGIPGLSAVPVQLPAPYQSTVFESLPQAPFANLSVPGFRTADALHLRPKQPLVFRHDAKQTAANLILGALYIVNGKSGDLPSQLDCAVSQNPDLTLVELGYVEALEAAVHGDPKLLPPPDSFKKDFEHIIATLKKCGSNVLILTIPDPLDTANFSDLETAARVVKVEPSFLQAAYGFSADTIVTASGLIDLGNQILSRNISKLEAKDVLQAPLLKQVSNWVETANTILADLAEQHGCLLYDLHKLIQSVKKNGLKTKTRSLSSEFLGGFFLFNGCYPGATGHAVLANELLSLLNKTYGSNFPLVDVEAIAAQDATVAQRPAAGPNWPPIAPPPPMKPPAPVAAAAVRKASKPAPWRTPSLALPTAPPPALQLPPGYVQVLPLNHDSSYFGDALRAVHCTDPNEIKFGICGNQLFGGLAMGDNHLDGFIRIEFKPQGANSATFTVSLGEGLSGTDSTLVAPQLFKLPMQQAGVSDVPGAGPDFSGTLDLTTGIVTDLNVSVMFTNTALVNRWSWRGDRKTP